MEELSNNISESSTSNKVDNDKCYKYKNEIDEILREESECGLVKTMSPDEHLIPAGSDITYSQFKNAMKEKNLKYKTSTLKVNTQELSDGLSQFLTISKQLGTHKIQSKSCTNKLKQYTPKSISYIKRILETTKNMMPNEECTDDIICVFDSSETKSGLDENVNETGIKENDGVKCNVQQNRKLQNVNSNSYISSSEMSVISNSCRSNDNKTYNNKRSASDEMGLIKRRCSGLKASHNHVEDTIENGHLNERQYQTVYVTVEMSKPVIDTKIIQVVSNSETNVNLKKCVDGSATEDNVYLCHDKKPELAPKAGSSQVQCENIFTNKTSELSEICPRINAEKIKITNESLQSCVNPVAAIQDITPSEWETSLNENCLKLAEESDTDIFLDSKSSGKIKSNYDSITDTGSETHKTLVSKAAKKNIKYKLLQNLFKLLLESPIKNSVTEFIQNDQQVQQLLKGWKLDVNVETDPLSKIYSKNICDLCRNWYERKRDNCINNLQKVCINSDVALCTKATQTERSLIRRDHCASRLKWIHESCSDSEEDLDLNLFFKTNVW